MACALLAIYAIVKKYCDGNVSIINTLERHREILRQAFNLTKNELCIVSHFLRMNAIQKDDIITSVCSIEQTELRNNNPILDANTEKPEDGNLTKKQIEIKEQEEIDFDVKSPRKRAYSTPY